MATFKAHKDDFRWITNAHDCIYSNIAAVLTSILKTCIEPLQISCMRLNKKIKLIFGIDIQSFWVINFQYELTINLPEKIYSIFSVDIKKCYECIPHNGDDGLKKVMKDLITRAFVTQHATHISYSHLPNSYELGSWSHNNKMNFSLKETIEINEWLIDNSFVSMGTHIYRQKHGIPMGLACSPIWCNLYLHFFERRFIEKIAKAQNTNILMQFSSSYRYFDDLLLINCLNPHIYFNTVSNGKESIFQIYPKEFIKVYFSSTSFAKHYSSIYGYKTQYLGMSFRIGNNKKLRIWRTRKQQGFHVLRFIHRTANRPKNWAYKTILSQILPILYMCNNSYAAVLEVKFLIDCFCLNGFERAKL